MSRYNTEHFDLLLAAMLRHDALIEDTKRLDVAHLRTAGGTDINSVQLVVFKVLKDFYGKHGKRPDPPVFLAEANALASKSANASRHGAFFADYLQHVIGLSSSCTDASVIVAREMISWIVKVAIIDPQTKDILAEATKTNEITGLSKRITELETQLLSSQGGLAVSNLQHLPVPETGSRSPTFIPWLDARFGAGKGPTQGSVIAIIAPSGGGKTTLGIQLATAQAANARHAVLVLLEEGLTQPMRAKIFASALGCDWPVIAENMKDGNITPGIEAAVRQFNLNPDVVKLQCDRINEFLHVIDLYENNSAGVDTIIKEVYKLHANGKTPAYVYVDWAGPLAERILQGIEVDREYTSEEAALKSIGFRFTKPAQQLNCLFVVSHQMNSAESSKVFSLNDMNCAAGCKGFAQPMKYMFVINKTDDKTGCCGFFIVKARDDERGEGMVLRLLGAQSRFISMNDTRKIHISSGGKRFRFESRIQNAATAGGGYRMPQEDR